MISLSPLRLPSPSFNQNAISSQIAATAVTPRMLLKLAACTLMSMPFTSDTVSDVAFSTIGASDGDSSNTPATNLNACPACICVAAKIGRMPRSPGASMCRQSQHAAR